VGVADVVFLLLAVGCIALVWASRDRPRTAAVLYVVSLPLVDLPIARFSGFRPLTLLAVTLVLLVLTLVRQGELRRLGTPAYRNACLPLLLLLVWAAVSGLVWTSSSFGAWGGFARPALTSVVVLLAARRSTVARAMASAFVVTMAALSAVGVVQFFWGRFFWSIGKTLKPDYEYFIELPSGLVRAPGSFQDPNNMGIFAGVAFLLVALALLESGRDHGLRLKLPGLALLLLAGMAASLTRSAVLATGVGLVLLWPRRQPLGRRLRLLLVAAACVAAAVMVLRLRGGGLEGMGSVKHRLLYWRAAVELALEQPLTGIGLGNFGRRFTATHTELPLKIGGLTSHRPHNAVLQVAVETGLPGLACLVAYLGLPLLSLVRRPDAASRLGAALLAAVLVHAGLHNVLLQDLFWLVGGVALALALRGGDEDEARAPVSGP
jgi:O-antigen ligase